MRAPTCHGPCHGRRGVRVDTAPDRSPAGKPAHDAVGLLPSAMGERVMSVAGTGRPAAVHLAIEPVRRGDTVSPW